MPRIRSLFTRRSLEPDEIIPQVSDAELLEWGDHLRHTPSPSEPLRLRIRRPDRPLRAAPVAPRKAQPTILD